MLRRGFISSWPWISRLKRSGSKCSNGLFFAFISGIWNQQSRETGHCSGLLCPFDEENPARPAEDPWGWSRQQAAPPVRIKAHIYLKCVFIRYRCYFDLWALCHFLSCGLQVFSRCDVSWSSRPNASVLHQREPRSLSAQYLPLWGTAGCMLWIFCFWKFYPLNNNDFVVCWCDS